MKVVISIVVIIVLLGILLLYLNKKNAHKKIAKAKDFLQQGNIEKSLVLTADGFYLPIGKLKPEQGQNLLEALDVFYKILEKESLEPSDDMKTLKEIILNQKEESIELDDKLKERLEKFVNDISLSDKPLVLLRKSMKSAGKITSVPEFLSVIGNVEKAEIEATYVNSHDKSTQVPLALACFPPDNKFPYYRYVSCWMSRTMQNAGPEKVEVNFSDFCFCSKEKDSYIIGDMANLAWFQTNQLSYFFDGIYLLSLEREGINKGYLTFQYKGIAETLEYDGFNHALLTFVPIKADEYNWITEKNQQYSDSLGSKVFREWLEYRGYAPLGTPEGVSLIEKDGAMMNDMIEEISISIKENTGDWFSKHDDKEYAEIYQAIVSRLTGGKVDKDIELGGTLITTGKYDEAISLYKGLIEEKPSNAHLYKDQIGAAYFFKKDYHEALKYYIEASEKPNNHNDYNIWEVCEILYKKENDKKYIENYLNIYPEGEYSKSAKKILNI